MEVDTQEEVTDITDVKVKFNAMDEVTEEKFNTYGKWIDALIDFNNLIEHAKFRKAELISELSICDRKISDIQHYIELMPNMNCPKAYEAYRLDREVLRKRRQIKNEMEIVSIFETISMSQVMQAIGIFKEKENTIKNKQYVPREMPWLFEGM